MRDNIGAQSTDNNKKEIYDKINKKRRRRTSKTKDENDSVDITYGKRDLSTIRRMLHRYELMILYAK